MANELRELQLQGDSTVYKLNDARITTTAVTTATHFLATDGSVSSIAPITAANLASVVRNSYIKTASVYSIGGQWVTVPNITEDDNGLWCLWLGNETVNKIYFITSYNKVKVLNESWFSISLQFVGTSLQVQYSGTTTVNFGRLN